MHACCSRLYNFAAAVLYRELNTSRTVCEKKWDLVSAVCLERKPVISSTSSDLENKYIKLLQDIEYENSYKSHHEVRKEMERKQNENFEKDEGDAEIEVLQKQTAQDLEDLYQGEISAFQFAPRTTKADEENDVKSLDRKLDKYLMLAVCQKLGDNYTWVLPQGERREGETMRQAAERILAEKCGNRLHVRFWSNAPCGFYKYKYPKVVRERAGALGAKIFFFKAWHISGQAECDKSFIKDYKWSCSEELGKDFHSEYYRSVSQFLIDS